MEQFGVRESWNGAQNKSLKGFRIAVCAILSR